MISTIASNGTVQTERAVYPRRSFGASWRALMPIATVKRRSDSGMTLTEILFAMTIGAIAIAMATSSFLLLGRSGAAAASYSVFATDSGQALAVFAQDVRMASAVTWHSDTSVTLFVQNNYASSGNQISYVYDTDSSSPTYQCFYSKLGDASASTTKKVLVRNISKFGFSRYNRLGAVAANDTETKRLGLSMKVRGSDPTLRPVTGDVVSADFYLRNTLVN